MRRRRRVLVGAAAVAGAAAAAVVAAERRAIRKARSHPDPERGERLDERPGAERRVRSFDGTELAVHVLEPGSPAQRRSPTLVFVHGFTLNLTAWHYQWKDLSTRYRCVLYDQRGHGRSAPGSGNDYSLEAFGEDLRAVLDACAGEGQVVLIGHSLGGMAIIAFAEAHPEEFGGRVRAVVLANTSAGDILKAVVGSLGAKAGTWVLPYARRLAASPARAYRVRSLFFRRRADLAFLIARLTNFGPDAPPSLVDYVVSLSGETPMEVWPDVMASIVEMDLAHALEHIRVPSLVLAADQDRVTPPSSALAMKRRLPDARMVVFRDVGHCAMLEHHEEFNRLLHAFVREALEPAGAGSPAPAGAEAEA